MVSAAGTTDRIATWSLRRRLALIAVFVVVASIALGGAAMYWAASVENDQIVDARLEQFGATVLAFAEHDSNHDSIGDPNATLPLVIRPSSALLYRYQIWSANGLMLARSNESLADAPMAPLSQLGFSTVSIEGEEHRVFSLPSTDGALIVQVGENTSERWRDIGRLTVNYMGYLIVPFCMVTAIAWLLLQRAFRSVESVAELLGHRNPLDLTPLRVDDPPEDLLPILASIDGLFARVGQAIATERRFTSVAAHEIRTPLAGLRAQAQLASMARNDDELQDALRSVRSGVDRASHLLDQLLDLARVDALPADSAPPLAPVNLLEVYQQVMLDVSPKASARQIHVHARFEAEVLSGHRFALSVLLRNMLDNAVRYSPAGGTVEVRFAPQSEGLALTVDDAGPGIRAQDRQRAFERFDRLGETRVEGVGLGLSIVLSVVELHRATIQLLDSPLGGLRVQVLFPCDAGVADAVRGADQTPA